MASKSPRSKAPSQAVEAGVLSAAHASAEAIPAALAAPKPAPAKRVPAAPKQVAVTSFPIDLPSVDALAVVEAAAPLVAAPVTGPAPEPDITSGPAPAAAPAPAITQKEAVMETVTNVAENTEAQARAMFAETTDRAKTALEKGTKLFADINDFSKGNMEAVVESTKIAARGAEDVARYTTDYAKAAVEKANANARQFAAVKSPTEFMKLQNEFAKDAVDAMMAETAKFTESYLKLLGEIAQPISNRVAVAADKMKLAA